MNTLEDFRSWVSNFGKYASVENNIEVTEGILELRPPADDKVCTIKFTIHRLSGEVETWRRMNFGFLKAIRKQMLIWRLVDAEHKVEFDQQGQKVLEQSVEV